MTLVDSNALAQAIIAHHARVFAPEGCDRSALPPQPVPEARASQPAYLAALQACSALGFIAIDAQCLARAWQAQTERTGQFDAAHWPDDARDFGLIAADASEPAAFAPCPQSLGLYAVLPDAQWVGRMARAGVPTLQLRFKSDDQQAITREVRAAVAAVAGSTALLFINDHWQAAIDAGAYGVHVGQEDLDALPASALDAIRAAGLRLGVSTHGYAEMLRAQSVRPSYIALGAVFPTTLKRMATAPQGVARLAAYVRLLRQYPLVAIGGIGAEQFPEILATGAGSIAVVRALVNAADPEAQAQALQAAWR